ncbi:MAG: hypothetical protein Q9182_005971 [Xanthomendoza sp. 2 TL-2023]
MQITDHDQIRALSEQWNQQAGPHFDLTILILAAINVTAACGIIVIICGDAHTMAAFRRNSSRPYTGSLMGRLRTMIEIHPAEVLPLVTATAIALQGTVYIVVQVIGLHSLVKDCEIIAQVVWPALWVVPYTMLVFCLETCFRLHWNKSGRYHKRRSIFFCIAAVLVATFFTWIPSYLAPSRGICPATLVWWTTHYAKIGLAISSGLLLTFVAGAIIITGLLMRNVELDHNQRISETRVVYYLIMTTSLLVLVVPFFAQRTLAMDAIRTAWVAEVALNLYGIISLALHIFLRSNADRAVIRAVQGIGRDKKQLRLLGPSDLEMTMVITSPVLSNEEDRRHQDDDSRIQPGERTSSHTLMERPPCAAKTNLSEATNAENLYEIMAQPSRPVRSPPQVSLPPRTLRQGSIYSIFPTFRSAMLRNSISTTFSQDEETKSLQAVKALAPFNHKRESSGDSSALVQIGLRFSDMSDAQRQNQLSATASSCCLPLQGTSRYYGFTTTSTARSSRGTVARDKAEVLP